ncbi:MAG TPA: Ig-like domain-containing protein, partial [Gemmatimonadaceae bacterium]|nr:Ig-like domain-containing protein [Gemmatimonadaceae bacterium]
MPAARLALALAVLSTALSTLAGAQSPAPLRVIRSTPTGDAAPNAEISVTFDRPVAGSLDRSIDATSIFRIEPAVAGRVEWRDPVTIRLRPTTRLVSGTRYAVTIANTFRAMDGSALAEPYRYTFRAQGPRLLAGSPVSENERAEHVAPNQQFALVYSSAVDLAKLSTAAYVELRATCGGQRVVRLRATSQRAIRDDDPWNFREAGGWQRDRSIDSLRRVVQVAPESALPRACAGELVAPTEVEDEVLRTVARWPFDTYGDLRIALFGCGASTFCPSGPLTVTFSNPVRGADVLRHVRLLPDAKFAIRDTLSEGTSWTLEARLQPHVTYAVAADTAIRDVFGQRLVGNPAAAFRTTGYAPDIVHPFGRLLVERTGFRTL